MFTPRIELKRVVAALLPVSLLWVFAACVSICGWEGAEAQGRPDFAPTVEATEMRDAPDCEDCPDASFLKAATPERATLKVTLQAAADISASTVSGQAFADGIILISPYRQFSFADPPLRLLPALRI
ncbi:MAG TPA: hypothetical protein VF611_04330 [Pyrinomonadaceae bacterium]|jgi:hypothetical protein